MAVRLEPGDMREVLVRLRDESVRVQSIVTDPPYHLTSIVKRFGSEGAAAAKAGSKANHTGAYARADRGFMGKQWDGGDIAFQAETWRLCWDLLPPGGHLLAFSGTRTYHRMACAIEDAGFEIRDMLAWLYGSGFPKSHDMAKAMDRVAGIDTSAKDWVPSTPGAIEWRGWGTALKPAIEPICFARKPLEGTVAANVLKHGTGALNIDACRIATSENLNGGAYAEVGGRTVSGSLHAGSGMNQPGRTVGAEFVQPPGRWPANVVHDGSDEVVRAFPGAPGQLIQSRGSSPSTKHVYGSFGRRKDREEPRADSGSAARFYYSSKADADDRLGSKHPTVKPVDLMRWLIRLVTPPGGRVLDPFAGSGTTGMACLAEGFDCILVEREAEYVADIKRRIAHVSGEDTPLFSIVSP